MCWNLPPMIAGADGVTISFDVTFTDRGKVMDIAVIDYTPRTISKEVVRSASAAIERCAPYPDAAGTLRVEMLTGTTSEPIDPFK